MAAEGFVAHRSGFSPKRSSVTPSTRPSGQNSIFDNICERRNWPKSCDCDRCNPAATKASRSTPLRRLSMSTTGRDDGSLDAPMVTQERKERTDSAIQNLMARHDPILLFASRLLPPNKATDASALYAWCRRLDEICDSEENSGDPELVQRQLDVWQKRFENLWSSPEECTREAASASSAEATTKYTEDDYLMDLALKECIERYQYLGNEDERQSLLTREPFDDMIDGMKADAVGQRRIQDMDELELYAYQVAGTVGLMLLPLLLKSEENGSNNKTTEATFRAVETAKEPAICLGKAIQLVNILRDATQDAKLGRMYLPRDMLRDEGLTEQDEAELLREVVFSGSNTPAPDGYKRVVRKVSNRAHVLLARAEDGRSTLPAPLGPVLVQVIVELYRDYLQELERRGYDNLGSRSNGQDRVKISTLRKFQASLRAATKVFF
eukprot:CAMPEP_0172365150 /NCGR_PEP_ID=MMETSP1060-20121228/8121_1 /TAXON_ID=37318 /ORGANISM="Pseudo-nitzschia pungens, Strain cf. cingulata" /LENGTH=438 /DNA_ID=CAMNT_0013088353 /DNA_START=175 /DNA_END=1491 /DNA_ORIENTATION=-